MALSPLQHAALKTYIESVPALAAYPLSGDGYFDLALRLNTELVTPDFWVWKEMLTLDEIYNNGFLWIEVDGLSVGKARIWEWMFDGDGITNPARQNVRAGIEECWKGTAGRLAVQAAVFDHAKKLATHVERVFAVASLAPPTPVGDPGVLTHVATSVITAVTPADVEVARNLP